MAIANQVARWQDIHELALPAMAHAVVFLAGGVDRFVARNQSFVVRLLPRRHPSDGNPAKAFQISSIQSASRDDHPFLKARWEELQARREQVEARIRNRPPADLSRFCGIAVLIYEVCDMDVVVPVELDLWRPRRLDDTAPLVPWFVWGRRA